MYSSTGYEQITGAGAAVALTVPSFTQAALVQAEGGIVRWRSDGTSPTAAVGMILDDGVTDWLLGTLSTTEVYVPTGVKVNVSYLGGV